MKLNSLHWIGVFCLVLMFGTLAKAEEKIVPFTQRGTEQLSEDFADEREHRFEGEVPYVKTWGGLICSNCYLKVNTKVQGEILDETEFSLNEDGSIGVVAELANLHLLSKARYCASPTFCQEISGWVGVGMDSAHILARVYVADEEQLTAETLKVEILETKFGRMHVGKYVPGWFEDSLTYITNKAVGQVWQTFIGDWISKKLSKGLAKYLDVPA